MGPELVVVMAVDAMTAIVAQVAMMQVLGHLEAAVEGVITIMSAEVESKREEPVIAEVEVLEPEMEDMDMVAVIVVLVETLKI